MEPNAWRVGWLMFWMAVRWWISHDFWHRESTTMTNNNNDDDAPQTVRQRCPPIVEVAASSKTKRTAGETERGARRTEGARHTATHRHRRDGRDERDDAIEERQGRTRGRGGSGERGGATGAHRAGAGRFSLLTFEERSAIGLTRKRKVNFEECRPNPSLPLRRPRRRSPRRFSPAPMASPPRTSPRSILFEDQRRRARPPLRVPRVRAHRGWPFDLRGLPRLRPVRPHGRAITE